MIVEKVKTGYLEENCYVLSIDKKTFTLKKVHSSPVAPYPFEILSSQHYTNNNNHILLLDNNIIQIINYS